MPISKRDLILASMLALHPGCSRTEHPIGPQANTAYQRATHAQSELNINGQIIARASDGSVYTTGNYLEDMELAGARMPNSEEQEEINRILDSEERLLEATIALMKSSDIFLRQSGMTAAQIESSVRRAHKHAKEYNLTNRYLIKDFKGECGGVALERFFKTADDNLVIIDDGIPFSEAVTLHEALHDEYGAHKQRSLNYTHLMSMDDGSYGATVVQEKDVPLFYDYLIYPLVQPGASYDHHLQRIRDGEDSDLLPSDLLYDYRQDKDMWLKEWEEGIWESYGRDLEQFGISSEEFHKVFSRPEVYELNHERIGALYREFSKEYKGEIKEGKERKNKYKREFTAPVTHTDETASRTSQPIDEHKASERKSERKYDRNKTKRERELNKHRIQEVRKVLRDIGVIPPRGEGHRK